MISESIFLLCGDSYGLKIKAASWDEAMDKAFIHMVESDYGDDGQGTERISYNVYKLPASVHGDSYIPPAVLDGCESRNGTYVRGREA